MRRQHAWPIPGQVTQLDRSRQIAIGWRELAMRLAARLDDDGDCGTANKACAALDRFSEQFGEVWMLPRIDDGTDAWTRVEVATFAKAHPDTVSKWTADGWIIRYPDGLYSPADVKEFLMDRPDLARKPKRQTAARAAELDL